MTSAPDPDRQEKELIFLRQRRFARVCALRFLYQADLAGGWELKPETLERFWDQSARMDDAPVLADLRAARTYADKLITAVFQKREAIDARIGEACPNWSLDRMGAVDRNLLRIAACEILFSNGEVPPVAAVNEAIELAKEFSDKDSSRFVNGVLDRLLP